jgi:hypothetical protein
MITRNIGEPVIDIARGLVEGRTFEHTFGFNDAVPNGTFADIWAYGPTDPTYNWPTTTESFRIAAGGDANDTAAGTGAREITMRFLDGTGNIVEEAVATNGISASLGTATAGRRILSAWVSKVGTYGGSNIGTITIENVTTNQIVAFIPIGIGATQLSQFTVPVGWTGVVTKFSLDVSAGANKDADIRMWKRENAFVTTGDMGGSRLLRRWIGFQGTGVDAGWGVTIVVPELTDVWVDAKGNGSVTAVGIEYDMILMKNP